MAQLGLPVTNDFDFILGRWTIANRRLKAVNVGSDDWDTFASTSFCEPRLDGLANIEEVRCPDRGWIGMAVRTFDIAAQEWAIYWVSSADGLLQPPVRGRFGPDGCVLEGDDRMDDQPIRARFIWSDISPHSARWTQAFSFDDGATWETNWIMDFTRVGTAI